MQPTTWDPWTWDPFSWFGSFFTWIMLITVLFIVVFLIIVFVIIYFACRVSKAKRLDTISTKSTFDLTSLPRRTRKVLREQLPRECPECDAPLKYAEVKWTGPHQAECPYCGHSVTLELIETTVYE
ncbi:MAG: hypothetical protein ACFFDP_00475 [Promethearchaeota archaeon]